MIHNLKKKKKIQRAKAHRKRAELNMKTTELK